MEPRVRWLGCSFLWLVVGASLAAQVPTAQERIRLYSGRYGLRTEPAPSVIALDAGGVTQSRLAIDGWHARFGPGEVLALVEAEPRGAERAVRVLGARFEERGRFGVARDREVVVGLSSLVLKPRAEHAAGSAFDLEFLDLRGAGTGVAARADLTLTAVEASAAGLGHWVVHSVDHQGEPHVHLFDARGVLQWEHVAPSSAQPVVEVAPFGELAALGVLQDDLRHSTLSWIDADGRILGSLAVPPFRTACFDPTGHHLAIGAGPMVALVPAGGSELLWSRATGNELALGRPLAFSRDGRELLALVADADPEHALVVPALWRFSGPPETLRSSLEPLTLIPAGPRPWVLELSETEDGDWHLVTKAGLWRF